ncbi:MAG: hypothetical protein KBT06_07145 [Prevotellaceae bacterium]|nr:hypothetical protein [Candidatus Colivivens equi]
MLYELFDKLGEIFSNGGYEYSHSGNIDIASILDHSGIDLSMYDANEIEDAIKSAIDTDSHHHSLIHGHDISFGASFDVDARNLAKSTLITKLGSNHIYTSTLYTDNIWGGLDSYSGKIVYEAINDARDNNRISDSVFRELIALLKKACHSQ